MEKLGTGIGITMICPGPTFSNFMATAATEKAGQVCSFICNNL